MNAFTDLATGIEDTDEDLLPTFTVSAIQVGRAEGVFDVRARTPAEAEEIIDEWLDAREPDERVCGSMQDTGDIMFEFAWAVGSPDELWIDEAREEIERNGGVAVVFDWRDVATKEDWNKTLREALAAHLRDAGKEFITHWAYVKGAGHLPKAL